MAFSASEVPKLDNLSLLDFVTPLSSLIQKDWARQFLLESTPESVLSVLTSRTHQKHALAGEFRNQAGSNEDDDILTNSSGLESFFNANWVIVPAFNVDRYSALLFVKEETNRWDKSIFAQHMNRATPWSISSNKIVQVVLDNVTGTKIGVFSDDQSYYAMVMRRKANARTRHRGFFRVPKDVLLANDVSSIISNIPTLIHTSEISVCSQCAPGICVCPPLSMYHPRFALDLTTTGMNMMSQVGAFAGQLQSSGLFSKFGRPTPIVGCISGGNKRGTLPRLISWGITNLLSRALSSSSPTKSPCSIDIAIAAQVAIAEQLKLLSSELQGSSTDAADNSILNIPEPTPNESSIEQTSLRLPINDAITLSDGVLINETEFDQALGIINGNETNSSTSRIPDLLLTEPIAGTLSSFTQAFDDVPTNNHLNPFPIQNSVPIRHSLLPLSSPQPPRILKGESDEDAKALRRKLRNRESAARSNLKKQLRRAELKSQITEARQKQSALESRLEKLRTENKELQKRVSSIN